MSWLIRRIRLALARADLRDIDRVEAEALHALTNVWIWRADVQRRIEELSA